MPTGKLFKCINDAPIRGVKLGKLLVEAGQTYEEVDIGTPLNVVWVAVKAQGTYGVYERERFVEAEKE